MAFFRGPNVVTNGLVLALDAANPRSYIDSTENLVIYSEQFDNGNWNKYNSSIGSNVTIAPDGTTTADKLIDNATNLTHYVRLAFNNITDSRYTVSVYAKAAEHSYLAINGNVSGYTWISFNLSNGTIVYTENSNAVGQIESVGNGWYRCSWSSVRSSTSLDFSFSTSPTSGGYNQFVFVGDGASGIYLWGAQLQKGSTVNPYYATTNLPRTNWNDLSGNNNSGSFINGPTRDSANNGSFTFNGTSQYVDCGLSTFQPTALTLSVWVSRSSLNDGTIIGRGNINSATELGISFGYNPSFGPGGIYPADYYITGRITTSTNQLLYQYPRSSLNTFHNIVYTVVNNTSAALYYDGNLVSSTNTVGSIGIDGTNFLLGKLNNYGPLGGKIANALIYNRALSASEVLQNYNALKSRFNLN
jgi:hypothetical protein